MKKRIAIWDNLKFLLIILVVFGHYAQHVKHNSAVLQGLCLSTYLFHMPLFIFVTGMFSKRTVNEKNVKKVLPYLTCFLATTLILFITKAFLKWNLTFEIFGTGAMPWYLMSMFFMFLITMVVKDYKPQYVMTLSLIIGVLVGFCKTDNPDFLTWMRTFIFYPFFYLGYTLDADWVEKVTNKIYLKISAIIFFIVINVLAFSFPKEAGKLSKLFTARHTYNELGKFADDGWIYRILVYALSFAAIFLLISLIPRKRIKGFTVYGERTLGIYMFHYVIIYILVYSAKLPELLEKALPFGWDILFIPIAIITAYLCGNRVFDFISRKLFSSDWKLKG